MPSSSEPGSNRGRPADGTLPSGLQAAAQRLPLYQALAGRRPRYAHTAEDLQAIAKERGDPFGGRHDGEQPPAALVQVARDLPLYWALAASDLNSLAGLMAGSWRRLGIRAGQRIAFYDYATSPIVLYASRSYVPHLEAGAADILGCLPICNDGLPELADRCLHILEYVQPSVLFVDVELVDPLLRAIARKPTPSRPGRLVITSDEAPVGTAQLREWSSSLGTEVTQMLRADGPLFFAAPCATEPMTFHADEASYLLEVSTPNSPEAALENGGRITVTNLALQSSVVIRYVTNLLGEVRSGACRCGRTGTRVVIDDVA